MSADALSPSLGWGQFPSWNWNSFNSNSGIGIEDATSILEFFTIHLKFIPPIAKTSFKPNFELDNGSIPWFFSFYFLVINICPNNGEIALLTD